ncbi:MAG TPA: ABC transporter ATP-binding protein/permease [Saprospiraceae bacterium]|nr:ABC transporter ATP-binding protein/permease [Saprospiraceae bacterium]
MISILRQAVLLGWKEADGFVKNRFVWALLLTIITAVFSALAPIVLKFAIDSMGAGDYQVNNQDLLQDWGVLNQLFIVSGPVILILLYIFSLWLSKSSGELRWFFYGTADQRLHRNISRNLFDHVLKLPLAFHLDRKTGALNQTLVQGIAGYSILLNVGVFTILPVLIEIILISAVLVLFLSPPFLIILLLSVIAYSITFAIGVAQIKGPSREVSTSQIDAYAALTDSILNSETVKYFSAENFVNDQYDTSLAKAESGWASFYACKTINGLFVACVFAISLGFSIVLASKHIMLGTMTLGDFVLINTYMLQIIRPLEALGVAFRSAVQGVAFIERMLKILENEAENFEIIQGARASASLPSTVKKKKFSMSGSELVFDRVSFSYFPDKICSSGMQKSLLEEISFVIKPGKVTAIVGSSGAGKSSIIRLLLRFFEPNKGDILLNGISTSDIPLSDLRQYIAVVPQDTVLFNNTIAYNIGFGKQGSSQLEIEEAAKRAHIHDKIKKMPHGYQTMVGERGLKLSGGEKQRVSIARASLKDPKIFVFDEATSSLDTKTERQILDNLITVSKNATTLIIAHRLSTVVHADEILVLERGEFIERGNHEQLIRAKGTYASMWDSQQYDLKERDQEKIGQIA